MCGVGDADIKWTFGKGQGVRSGTALVTAVNADDCKARTGG